MQRKMCHSATVSTTNPTWSALGLSPGVCDESLVTGSRTVLGLMVNFVRLCVIKLVCS